VGFAGIGVNGDVGAIGDLETEDRLNLAVDSFLREANGEIALNSVEAEGCLVAVMVQAPCKDANLIEIERQSAARRGKHGDVFCDFFADVGSQGFGTVRHGGIVELRFGGLTVFFAGLVMAPGTL